MVVALPWTSHVLLISGIASVVLGMFARRTSRTGKIYLGWCCGRESVALPHFVFGVTMYINDHSNAVITWEFIDRDYLLPKVTCKYKIGDSFLMFEYSGNRQKRQKFRLFRFREKAALQAENALIRKLDKMYFGGCDILPRHMHDCLYQVYYDLGLEFGYIENPLRSFGDG